MNDLLVTELLEYFPEKSTMNSLTSPVRVPHSPVRAPPICKDTDSLAELARRSTPSKELAQTFSSLRTPGSCRVGSRAPSPRAPTSSHRSQLCGKNRIKAKKSLDSHDSDGSDSSDATLPSSHGFNSLAEMALRWDLPLDTLKSSSELFKLHAICERGEVLRDGKLPSSALKTVVCALADVSSLDELPPDSVTEILKTADTNSDGTLDFKEFATWYHQREFCECITLSKGDRQCRDIAYLLDMPVFEIENAKKLFDKFDGNGNAYLDYKEFHDFVNSLLGHRFDSRKTRELPESRIAHFWQLCDLKGHGHVEFTEFAAFYRTLDTSLYTF